MSAHKTSIIPILKELDCCDRCILFLTSDEGFKISDVIIDSYITPKVKLEEIESKTDQPAIKRPKWNICPGCLGILEDSTLKEFALQICPNKSEYYKSKQFSTLVSLPKCVLFRIYSIFLYIREKLPEMEGAITPQWEGPFKRIFRIVSSEFISRRINKIYKANSELSIEIEIIYGDDEEELKHLRNKKKKKNVSRLNIDEFLRTCTEEEFRAVYLVPPPSPQIVPTCRIKFRAVPMYLGGRYLKFSREMGQTPFIVNNKRITETSVEEVIFESIRKVLKFHGNMVFSSSGREDSDTRMLGDGRPFYIQFDDPSHYEVSFQQFREVEEEILKSRLCAVIKLQQVSQTSLRQIKDGEEFKKKHYKALCYTEHPDITQVVDIINKYKDSVLEVSQQTPIRVLHRRVISSRPKLIYSMTATVVPGFPHLFELYTITQAGTYVKEFVNSDFNRTTPSITSIIKYQTDVVALDVIKVELDWP